MQGECSNRHILTFGSKDDENSESLIVDLHAFNHAPSRMSMDLFNVLAEDYR